MKKNRGFTLLESLIVIVITAIIAYLVSIMMTNGFNIYLGEKRILDANWQGRLAMERMARDFRDIRSASSVTTINANQFTFFDTSNTAITYQLSGNSLTRNSIPLAEGINSLAFTYLDENGNTTSTASSVRYVRVALNVTQNNTNITLTTAINGRNLR